MLAIHLLCKMYGATGDRLAQLADCTVSSRDSKDSSGSELHNERQGHLA